MNEYMQLYENVKRLNNLKSNSAISITLENISNIAEVTTEDMAVRVSSNVWQKQSSKDKEFILIHEFCHIVAAIKYGNDISAHGPEWQQCMINAGVLPYRTFDDYLLGSPMCYVSCDCKRVCVTQDRSRKIVSSNFICTNCLSNFSNIEHFEIKECSRNETLLATLL